MASVVFFRAFLLDRRTTALLNNNGNTGATGNTANGFQALQNNTNGNDNVAIGALALANNMIGSQNTALGTSAGPSITGNGNICIRNVGVAGIPNTIRIGQSETRRFIAGIRGVTPGQANAVPVLIDSQGQLGTVSSSPRFKRAIKAMDETSEAIHALKPVTFHYKTDDTDTLPIWFDRRGDCRSKPGPGRAQRGEIYTVRYDAVKAMLLNEFLKRDTAELKSSKPPLQR